MQNLNLNLRHRMIGSCCMENVPHLPRQCSACSYNSETAMYRLSSWMCLPVTLFARLQPEHGTALPLPCGSCIIPHTAVLVGTADEPTSVIYDTYKRYVCLHSPIYRVCTGWMVSFSRCISTPAQSTAVQPKRGQISAR